jgi:protoheme IX farnesyltransferase
MSSPALAASRASAADYLELTKPRITLLVVFTALVGFVMASPGRVSGAVLTPALLGIALVAGGASALNMLLERDTDALMQRTRPRPLPAGRLRPVEALLFGLVLSGLGLGTLAWLSGWLCAAVALATWASYLFLYTPLKRRTSLSTLVGAVPGALPPVIGWTATGAGLEPGAYALFAIVFLWQVPHTLAIAWIYRDDYARGGLPVLPVLDREGHLTGRQAVLHCLALLLVSLAPAVAGRAGGVYLAGAAAMGVVLLGFAVRLAVLRSLAAARGLFLASVTYLPALFLLLLADRR